MFIPVSSIGNFARTGKRLSQKDLSSISISLSIVRSLYPISDVIERDKGLTFSIARVAILEISRSCDDMKVS